MLDAQAAIFPLKAQDLLALDPADLARVAAQMRLLVVPCGI